MDMMNRFSSLDLEKQKELVLMTNFGVIGTLESVEFDGKNTVLSVLFDFTIPDSLVSDLQGIFKAEVQHSGVVVRKHIIAESEYPNLCMCKMMCRIVNENALTAFTQCEELYEAVFTKIAEQARLYRVRFAEFEAAKKNYGTTGVCGIL